MDVPPRVQAVWDQVPDIPDCKGHCWQSCGPITCSKPEARLLNHALNGDHEPKDRDGLPMCPALGQDNRCTVYQVRPLICRLWGSVDDLPCPFGCKPRRRLTQAAGEELIKQLPPTWTPPWVRLQTPSLGEEVRT